MEYFGRPHRQIEVAHKLVKVHGQLFGPKPIIAGHSPLKGIQATLVHVVDNAGFWVPGGHCQPGVVNPLAALVAIEERAAAPAVVLNPGHGAGSSPNPQAGQHQRQ